ncbi:MAG: ATP-binding protein, partial [Acidobacteriota bacterium]
MIDDTMLASLRAALDATPDNHELRLALVNAYRQRGDHQALTAMLTAWNVATVSDPAHRRGAAEAWLEHGEAERALEWIEADDTAESMLVRARILLALDRRDEGREAYDRAVAGNAALEDRELRDRLGTKVRAFPTAATDGRPALRVISND